MLLERVTWMRYHSKVIIFRSEGASFATWGLFYHRSEFTDTFLVIGDRRLEMIF
jgi:hypothetical protein